ncbi:hypothetical protein LTR78_004286 [Recurvomyces mirabilis]|uniref:Uncharacterized protein n=1 Tax=Recurvomyces mirabilis TaxID=574656 RepID=A0AAE0WPM1_9PEZI|nr:hypothetical protein LTR78_004286 [Recurvomyces mirabilis]KAK5156047.1 hypothetical protein LTS14_005613 [Recurvomyces mirabilis]
MATNSRKRSHDDEQKLQQHAANATDDEVAQDRPIKISSSQTDDNDSELPSTFKITQPMMPPPLKPADPSQREEQQPPRSGQGSQKPRDAQTDLASTQAKASQLEDVTSESTIPDDEEVLHSLMPSEPQDEIADFDWTDLQARYHDRMTELQHNELKIVDEFSQLCDFFGIWADSMQTHEVGRSFKRLKTQTAYVRHEEDELEQKRGHYIKVVDAFKSALQLLGT